VFENRVLRRIFGPKRYKVRGSWRKMHKVELHNLCSSRNILKMIMSWRMSWTRLVARMGRRGMHIGYCWESQKEGDTRKTKT
jgi:hypothetical protein